MVKVHLFDGSATQIFHFELILKGHGHEVITAESGRDGVVFAQRQLPDVVLLDISMPDMNGVQAKRLLSRLGDAQHISVGIVSRKDQKTDKFWRERQGARGDLTKPDNKTELSGLVEGLL
ncbi:MAG: two-component system response regulator [Gammaproteobacteria bacterium]|nr:two-component system response regulator [Gammaproteobacteria bacterium]